MDLHLTNKNILLIDFAGRTSPTLLEKIARQILSEGGLLFIASAKESLAQTLSTKISEKIHAFSIDPASDEGRNEIFKAVPQCDVFIDATLPFIGQRAEETNWDNVFTASVRAPQLLSFPYLRQMKENNWGRILILNLFSNAMRDPSEANIRSIEEARAAYASSLSKTLKGTLVSANLCQLNHTGYPAPKAETHISNAVTFLSSEASDGLNNGVITVEC
ncbi:hypothetical protein FAI40_08630 [Acetobacteraceae bacterium]|nr:hypothetical protein FAI40_08630 [Acetobacteraceae bacterium]